MKGIPCRKLKDSDGKFIQTVKECLLSKEKKGGDLLVMTASLFVIYQELLSKFFAFEPLFN